MNRTVTVGSLLALSILWVACSSPEPGRIATAEPVIEATPAAPAEAQPFKEELVICLIRPPASLSADTPVSAALLSLLTPTVYTIDANYIAQPGLLLADLPAAEAGTVRLTDRDTVLVDVTYNDSLLWSDGTPLTLDDMMLGLALPSFTSASRFDVISVQRLGGMSVRFTGAEGAEYPYVPSLPPMPAHVLTEADLLAPGPDAFRVTAGPYVVAEAADDWVLTANPNYAGTAPEITDIRIRFFTDTAALSPEAGRGACDVAYVPDGLVDTPNMTLASIPVGGMDMLLFNTWPDTSRPAFFAETSVRRAVAGGLNREALAAALGAGEMLPGSWLPANHWAYADGALSTDGRLDVAGWSATLDDGVARNEGASGTYACGRGNWQIEENTDFRVDLVYPDHNDSYAVAAAQIQADLIRLGIEVQPIPVTADQFYAIDGPLQTRAFDMALVPYPVRPDPGGLSLWGGQDVYLHPVDLTAVFRSGLEERWLVQEQLVELLAVDNTPSVYNGYTGQNYTGWCDEAATLAIVDANRALIRQDRINAYAIQQARFQGEVPAVPLGQPLAELHHAPYVCGVDVLPYENPFWNLNLWYFDESGACN